MISSCACYGYSLMYMLCSCVLKRGTTWHLEKSRTLILRPLMARKSRHSSVVCVQLRSTMWETALERQLCVQ